MVVGDASLVTGRRPGRLDAPQESLFRECAKNVVDGLTGNGPDLGPYDLIDVVRSAVGSVGDASKHGETLNGDVQAMAPEKPSVVD